ncbi:hypothetical protein TNCV_3583901 [Trichonephila clavipes]|nr:hypothetical protein TNCV_3583901 [Trichonephila clavipes]
MGSRTRGRPPTRWIDDSENDLKTLNIKNWQRVAVYRWNWRKRAVEAAKTYPKDPYTFGQAQYTVIFPLEHHMDTRSPEIHARGNTGVPSRAHLMRVKA